MWCASARVEFRHLQRKSCIVFETAETSPNPLHCSCRSERFGRSCSLFLAYIVLGNYRPVQNNEKIERHVMSIHRGHVHAQGEIHYARNPQQTYHYQVEHEDAVDPK